MTSAAMMIGSTTSSVISIAVVYVEKSSAVLPYIVNDSPAQFCSGPAASVANNCRAAKNWEQRLFSPLGVR